MSTLSGGCRCGSIRYECLAAPSAVSFCYCRDCQKASGGPFCNYAVVPAAAVRVTVGQTRSYTVQAVSGSAVKREFCADCGSPLFASNGHVFVLAVGCLDDARTLAPTIAIWLDSAQPWAPVPGNVQCFAQNPPLTLGGD